MMFMMTTPPTTSDSETTPTRIAKAPCENVCQRPISVSDVYMPKLSVVARPQVALHAQRDARRVHRRFDQRPG